METSALGSFSTDSAGSACVRYLLFPETDRLIAWQRNGAMDQEAIWHY
jgi:hypothetical protein